MLAQTFLAAVFVITCAGCTTGMHYAGKIVDSRGHPVPHAVVVARLYESGPGEEMFNRTLTTDKSGGFTVEAQRKLTFIGISDPRSKRSGELSNPSLRNTNIIVIR